MGYLTRYTLTIEQGPAVVDTECPTCGGSGRCELDIVKLVAGNESEFSLALLNEPVKWYEHEAELRNLSKKYPDTVFKLQGEGETQGDVWVKFFKNGAMVTHQGAIQLDASFDESELS